MKNPLVYTTLFVVLAGGFLLFLKWNRTAEAPLPPVVMLPADSEFPAAGVCSEIPEGGEARVAIHADIPSPRCQKVLARDFLVVENDTPLTLSLWFGDNKEYTFTVAPNGVYRLKESMGELFRNGVHVLHGSPYQGPAVWLIAEGSLGESGGALIMELGKEVNVKGISLTPLEVLSDSRCPVDVVCIWAGEIKVSVRIADEVEAVEKVFTIGSRESFGEIDIILEGVSPVTYSGKTIALNEYRFEFSVMQGSSTDN